MSISINGNGITSANIADGAITNADITDVAASKLTGALPAISGAALTNLPGGGKVLKVQSYEDRVDRSHSTTTLTDSGLSFSFTPTLATSKLIWVIGIAYASGDTTQFAGGRVKIGGVTRGDTVTSGSGYSTRDESPWSKTFEHQCSSTSAVVMTVELVTNDKPIYMNVPVNTSGFSQDWVTTATVFEIGA